MPNKRKPIKEVKRHTITVKLSEYEIEALKRIVRAKQSNTSEVLRNLIIDAENA